MNQATEFLMHQAPLVLFGVMFLEQIGLPIPSTPWLLAAGAVSAKGGLNLLFAVMVTVLACLIADVIWFYFGRKRGGRALRLLCRVSLEPNSCVRKTQAIFTRYGVTGILASKFLPGFGLLFPPLAGISQISFSRFLFYDGLGSLLYTGSFLYMGYVFSDQLGRIESAFASLSAGAIWSFVALGLAYLLFKFVQRKHFTQRVPV